MQTDTLTCDACGSAVSTLVDQGTDQLVCTICVNDPTGRPLVVIGAEHFEVAPRKVRSQPVRRRGGARHDDLEPAARNYLTAAAWPYDVEAGDTVTITATVKTHDTYEDEQQTVLTRAKQQTARENPI